MNNCTGPGVNLPQCGGVYVSECGRARHGIRARKTNPNGPSHTWPALSQLRHFLQHYFNFKEQPEIMEFEVLLYFQVNSISLGKHLSPISKQPN